MPEKPKGPPTIPGSKGRASENRKIRREALREELCSREYVRQITTIINRLEPGLENSYTPEDVPAVKARMDGYFKLLDKSLPSLKSVSTPSNLSLKGSVEQQAEVVIQSIANGRITPDEGASVLGSLGVYSKLIEFSSLLSRIEALEGRTGAPLNGKSHALVEERPTTDPN